MRGPKPVNHDGPLALDPAEHLGLMYSIAAKYAARDHLDRDELVGEAYEILHSACRTFDPSKGCKPSTHLHAALSARLQFGAYGRRQERGEQRRKIKGEYVWVMRPQPLAEWDGAGSETTEDRSDELAAVRRVLTETEEFVLSQRANGVYLADIAASLGRTKERVRQIEAAALRKARIQLRRLGYDHKTLTEA